MLDQPLLVPPIANFYQEFDLNLQRAGLSLSALHKALDGMGVRDERANTVPVGLRLQWLMQEQFLREKERLEIGCRFYRHPRWKFLLGVPLIYLPLLVGITPMMLCAILVRAHLTMVGGHNLKRYWEDFVPSWISHRYTRKNQIVPNQLIERFGILAWIARFRSFWIFNCKLYCPLSVALLAYVLYLVKIVEQWWCPFGHDKKADYRDVPIDKSCWHASGDAHLLHPEDHDNPSWNQEAEVDAWAPVTRFRA